MAYNFPVNYSQYYPNQFNSYPTQINGSGSQPSQQNSIIWVQGEAGAKSYLVAPNSTVQLWDSERQTIYLKSADASGMPSIKVLDYTIRSEAPNRAAEAVQSIGQTNTYKEDLEGIQSQIDALKRELEDLRRAKDAE